MAVDVAFVTGPASVPTVVQALNSSDSQYVSVDGFTLGAPTFSAAPDSVGGEYGWRDVSFDIIIRGTYSATVRIMQNVARQLLKDRNWLMVKQNPSAQPMFLRTYRTEQEAVSWENSDFDQWTLPLTLTADPFLYGTPQTVGPVTINNDPAAATNPCFYKLPAVQGDAPAPLTVAVVPSAAWDGQQPLMSVAALDPSVNPTGPVVWQSDAFTADLDTTLSVADTAFSGGFRSSVDFATDATMRTRLKGPVPTVPVPGRYKVLVRVARSTVASTFSMRFAQIDSVSTTTDRVYGDTKQLTRDTSPSTGFATWVDLGEFTFPLGADNPVLGETAGAQTVYFQMSRDSGVGAAYIDCFLLVPVDTAATVAVRTLVPYFAGYGVPTTRTAVFDADNRRYVQRSGAALDPVSPPQLSGDFLQVVPGCRNVFHMVQQTLTTTPTAGLLLNIPNRDVIANTAAVTFAYVPRYLHMRPDAG